MIHDSNTETWGAQGPRLDSADTSPPGPPQASTDRPIQILIDRRPAAAALRGTFVAFCRLELGFFFG